MEEYTQITWMSGQVGRRTSGENWRKQLEISCISDTG